MRCWDVPGEYINPRIKTHLIFLVEDRMKYRIWDHVEFYVYIRMKERVVKRIKDVMKHAE